MPRNSVISKISPLGLRKHKVLCFDLDGTLCTNTEGAYRQARPLSKRIAQVNALYRAGHRIVIFTARGTKTGLDWKALTRRQLKAWRLKYHALQFGKPYAEIYIDDKAVHSDEWFSKQPRKSL